MGCLMVTDLLEAFADPRLEASVGKVLSGELGETLCVEGILQMFKGEREVEDGGVYNSDA